MRRSSGTANVTNSSLPVISQNSDDSFSSQVEFSGFVVDVVKQLAREIPFQFEWLMDTRRTVRRKTADAAPVRRVLAGVRHHHHHRHHHQQQQQQQQQP